MSEDVKKEEVKNEIAEKKERVNMVATLENGIIAVPIHLILRFKWQRVYHKAH